jgi:hypothetical protein
MRSQRLYNDIMTSADAQTYGGDDDDEEEEEEEEQEVQDQPPRVESSALVMISL